MTSKISVEAKKSEFMVSNAMDDVTRASKKALMDYLCKMYYVPLAKTIAKCPTLWKAQACALMMISRL